VIPLVRLWRDLKPTSRAALLFLAVALLYAGLWLLPGLTFAPLDLPLDADAWKPDPTERVRVSNTLLADVVVQFVAWDKEILRRYTRGEAPWTNRFAGGDGSPLFANPQTALLSPFTWPRLLFGLEGWAIAAILKLLAAALCAYWLARELDVGSREAILSGLVYATAGYTIVWLLYPITNVFVLLPGLAAAALRLMKRASFRNAALVILFAALCTAGGHPETLFIGVIGIWIFLVWESEKRSDLGVIRLIPVSVGALLGFLLLAIQLAPFLAILGDGYAEVLRPRMPHPFRVWGVASQALPGILGTPLRGELDLTALPMAENFNLRAGGYIGAIVLLAIFLAWRDLAPSLRRGLIIGFVALVLSWYPPGFWTVLRHAPVLRLLTLEYGVALFVLFGALAAGPALAIAASRRRRKLGPALIIAGALALIAGLLPVVPPARSTLTRIARAGIEELRGRGYLRQAPEVYEKRLDGYLSAAGLTTVRRLAIPGACWLLAGIALSVSRRRALLLSLAAAGELVAFGLGFNPTVRLADVPPEPPAIAAIRQLDPSRQFLLAEHFEVFPANLGTIYQVRDVLSYDALITKTTVARLLPAGYDPVLHTFNPILRPEEVRALGHLGVRFILSRHDVAGAQRIAGPPAPAVGVYEIAGVAPTPIPPNHRPAGFTVGLVISLVAVLASAAWLRLFLLKSPSASPALPQREM
jgi:predicted small integral membrane protein